MAKFRTVGFLKVFLATLLVMSPATSTVKMTPKEIRTAILVALLNYAASYADFGLADLMCHPLVIVVT